MKAPQNRHKKCSQNILSLKMAAALGLLFPCLLPIDPKLRVAEVAMQHIIRISYVSWISPRVHARVSFRFDSFENRVQHLSPATHLLTRWRFYVHRQ